MYRFSRSIYRDLAPYVIDNPVTPQNGHSAIAAIANGDPSVHGHANGNGRTGVGRNGHANGNGHHNGNGHPGGYAAGRPTNRQRVLDACEAAMRRLAYDRRYFAHPARSLFGEVRMYFPIGEQDRVFRVIDCNVRLALEHLERLPDAGIALDGQPSECRAHTRKGTPCQREPLAGRDYCPSHKHLEESLEPAGRIDGIDEPASERRDSLGSAV